MRVHHSILLSIFTLLVFTDQQVVNGAKASSSSKVSTKKTKNELSNGQMALAGALATAFGVTIMHPIDTIKTLQQSDAGLGMGIFQATNQIAKNGGVGAFYSGLGPYVTSDAIAGALKFASYETLKTWIKDKVPEENYGAALFGCAGLAFLISSIALVPGELLKQRLQMGQINSIREGIPQIFKKEGIFGFYSGYSGVCLRDVPYTMLELGIYDNLKALYLKFKNKNSTSKEQRPLSQLDTIIIAGITGGISGYCTTPFDTVKTKLMVDTGYNGFFDCVAKTAKNSGVGSLFNGGLARVAWLMPFTAIYLPVYELLKNKFQTLPLSPVGVRGGGVGVGGFLTFPSFSNRKARTTPLSLRETLKLKHARREASLCF